jgi:hypothetical protein
MPASLLAAACLPGRAIVMTFCGSLTARRLSSGLR